MSSPLLECSPLALIDHAVQQVSQPPSRFALDAEQLGIHHGPTALWMPELRQVLAAPDTPIAVKNRAWAQLITHAQRDNPSDRQGWALTAIGVALPGLHAVASELARGYRGSRAELETEILAGFLTALTTARTASQRRFPVLLRAAHRAGLGWLTHCRLAPPPIGDTASDTASDTATGTGEATGGVSVVGTVVAHRGRHPDQVLADAVRAGILTSGEADLIAVTRLERRPLRLVAAEHDVTTNTVWMRRHRAEKRLIAALTHTMGAEDTDRAEDPTYAHLLASTSLTPPLTPPRPAATATPGPRSPIRARTRRPTQLSHTSTDTASPAPAADSAAVLVTSPRDRGAAGPRRHPPTSSADRRPEQSQSRHDLPGHNLSGHNRGGHSQSGHGQSGHGHHPAPPTGSQRVRGHHDYGHAPAGHSTFGPGHGHGTTSSTPPRPAPTTDPTRSEPAEAHTCGGGSDRRSTHRPLGRVTTAPTASSSPRPRLPVLVLLLMVLVGSWASRAHPAEADRPSALASELISTNTSAITSAQTPPTITTAAVTTAAVTTAAITTAADSTPLAAALLLPGSTPVSPPTGPAPTQAGSGSASGTDGTAQLTRVLTNIRNWLMGVLITLATVCLTIGGVRYLLAGGDPGEVEAAKRAVKSAAIGYALAVLAPALVAVLRNVVGV